MQLVQQEVHLVQQDGQMVVVVWGLYYAMTSTALQKLSGCSCLEPYIEELEGRPLCVGERYCGPATDSFASAFRSTRYRVLSDP